MRELIKSIVKWCSQNGQAESRFLYPNPNHYVYTFPLFDFLSEETKISKEEIGKWFNDEQEKEGR